MQLHKTVTLTTDRAEEVERLCRAIRQDLAAAVLEMAGIEDGAALKRLTARWQQLRGLHPETARALCHGIEQVGMALFSINREGGSS